VVFLLILNHNSLPFYNALSAKAISDQRQTSNIGMSVLSDAYCVMHNFQVQMLNRLLKGRHYCSGDDIRNRTCNLRINVIRRRVRVIIFAMEETNNTRSACVSVALFIQDAKRITRIVLLSVSCPAVPYFSALSLKQRHFRKKCHGR
jgi:uncharacterized Rmd1/YagE family protein